MFVEVIVIVVFAQNKSLSYDFSELPLRRGRIDEAAAAFLDGRLTSGHALLIARLPEEQQRLALQNTFAEDWRTKERNPIPVRTLAQWIRDNLMLTLADAVFDREDAQLLSSAGPCSVCSKRTGANAVLFDDFAHDDRCMDGICFQAKVDAHIARQKQSTAGLIQITRAYYTNSSGEEKG